MLLSMHCCRHAANFLQELIHREAAILFRVRKYGVLVQRGLVIFLLEALPSTTLREVEVPPEPACVDKSVRLALRVDMLLNGEDGYGMFRQVFYTSTFGSDVRVGPPKVSTHSLSVY